MKIIGVVLPYYMTKNARHFFNEMAQLFLANGDQIRFNGNGGLDSPMNIVAPRMVHYLPSKEFRGLVKKIKEPTEEQRLAAIRIAMEIYPNFAEWEQEEQELVLASVYTIYGYTGRKCDLVVIYGGKYREHALNKHLFVTAKKLAKHAGIKIKFVEP